MVMRALYAQVQNRVDGNKKIKPNIKTLNIMFGVFYFRDVRESGYPAWFGTKTTRWFESSHPDICLLSSVVELFAVNEEVQGPNP